MFRFLKTAVGCLGHWNPHNVKEAKRAFAVIAVTFGLRDKQPGLSNEAMAQVAYHHYCENGLALVLQEEIAANLASRYVAGRMSAVQENGKYHDTAESIREAAAICRQQGWPRVLVVGHRHHAWRVAKCAEKQGLEVVGIHSDGIPYDPKSTQKWCRRAWRYVPYELLLARPYYLLTGRM
jgi:hypothetical protein